MQPTTTGGGGGGGIGLSRFRSAPASWLEALLESEEEDVIIDPPKPPLTPPPHAHPFHHHQQHSTTSRPPATTYVDPMLVPPTTNTTSAGVGGGISLANRQNSLPAEFFSQINAPGDGFVSGYSNSGYDDYISPSGLDDHRPKFTTQLSGDQSALLDAEMDKLLGESVPCRVRAKRGCATHPRSIAERVRRTKISDRIRKLQDLVPNMDKQTNTADMLEEAVEYVKFLQRQIQELREHRDRCTCLVKV